MLRVGRGKAAADLEYGKQYHETYAEIMKQQVDDLLMMVGTPSRIVGLDAWLPKDYVAAQHSTPTQPKFKVGDRVLALYAGQGWHAEVTSPENEYQRIVVRRAKNMPRTDVIASIDSGWYGDFLDLPVEHVRLLPDAPPAPTAKSCPFHEWKSIPYSSMAEYADQQYAVRKLLTAGLREWPVCRVSGAPLEIEFDHGDISHTNDSYCGRFHCKECNK